MLLLLLLLLLARHSRCRACRRLVSTMDWAILIVERDAVSDE